MQTYRNYHNKLALILALALTSCSEAADFSSSEYVGKVNARSMKAEVHNAYLKCYPLDAQAKDGCLKELAVKYIHKARQNDKEYVTAFQFESEKLGFKHFLDDHKLTCEEVNGGPIFDANAKAYVVTCKPFEQYQVQFNYSAKEWKISGKN